MIVYVFEHVWDLTHHYHDGGGLVVVAQDVESARALVREKGTSSGYGGLRDDVELDFRKAKQYPTNPGVKPAVYVYPDAGCC